MGRRKKVIGGEDNRLLPKPILEGALNAQFIRAIEALILLRYADTIDHQLFQIADILNRRINENRVYFTKSKLITYTNICHYECKYCCIYCKPYESQAYTLSIDQMLKQISLNGQIEEVILQGGCNPKLKLRHYINMLREIKSAFPHLLIRAFSPAIIHSLSKRNKLPYIEVLARLKDAGLNVINGTSAVILNDKIRKKVCMSLPKTKEWIQIIKAAHKAEIPSTATMLFGHVEDAIHICEHLDIIKQIQLETGLFTSFVPVPFLPYGTKLLSERRLRKWLTINDIFRIFAISRLFFGKLLRCIQVDWTKIGISNAIQSINVGVNEIGPCYVDDNCLKTKDTKENSINLNLLHNALHRSERILVGREVESPKALLQVKARLSDLAHVYY
jgi:CofH subfamily radical SAM domain protein